jgi:hypothetical protein
MRCCTNNLRTSQQRRIDEKAVFMIDADKVAVQLSVTVWQERGIAAWVIVANKITWTVRAHCRAVGFSGA